MREVDLFEKFELDFEDHYHGSFCRQTRNQPCSRLVTLATFHHPFVRGYLHFLLIQGFGARSQL